jgi:hypothetical protein
MPRLKHGFFFFVFYFYFFTIIKWDVLFELPIQLSRVDNSSF